MGHQTSPSIYPTPVLLNYGTSHRMDNGATYSTQIAGTWLLYSNLFSQRGYVEPVFSISDG